MDGLLSPKKPGSISRAAPARAGQIEAGLATVERGLAIYEREFGANHCHLVYPLYSLGACQRMGERKELAIAAFRRALDNCRASPLHAAPVAEARFVLAQLLVAAGRSAEALSLAQEARRSLVEGGAQSAETLREVDAWLAETASVLAPKQ